MEILQVSNLSTKYITGRDAELLTEDARFYREMTEHPHPASVEPTSNRPVFLVHEYPEGFWVHVPDEETWAQNATIASRIGYSKHMIATINKAREAATDWLRLDRDGGDCDNLEEQDW
jgi:hypothetical protein